MCKIWSLTCTNTSFWICGSSNSVFQAFSCVIHAGLAVITLHAPVETSTPMIGGVAVCAASLISATIAFAAQERDQNTTNQDISNLPFIWYIFLVVCRCFRFVSSGESTSGTSNISLTFGGATATSCDLSKRLCS